MVQCPKCRQESGVPVSTGNDIDTVCKSIVCAYCSNPWIEFLPGQQVGEPYKHSEKQGDS
jgi:hypothetical protein